MGFQDGLPWRSILRWTFGEMLLEPHFRHPRLDMAMEQIFFSVRGTNGVERRYRLSIERGWPRVDQVQGPPEET